MKHIKKIIKFTLFFSIAFLYGVECSGGERVILDTILESRFVALNDSKKEQLTFFESLRA